MINYSNITEFEKKMNILLKGSGVDIAKGIELGIGVEKMGLDFYKKKKQIIKDKHAAYLFDFLAAEEEYHLKLLNELKESLKKKNQWIEITKKPARPKIFSDTDKSIDENSKDINIILAAMRVERDTQKLYLGIAEKLKSPDGRKFFSALSDFEQGHFELLDGILYNLTYNRVEA